jgi:hypothetical protein
VQRAPGLPRALISFGRETFTYNPDALRRGIAEPPLDWRVWKSEGVPNVQIFSPLWHFPLSRKRFMVRSDFADGRRKSIINIKGLAGS